MNLKKELKFRAAEDRDITDIIEFITDIEQTEASYTGVSNNIVGDDTFEMLKECNSFVCEIESSIVGVISILLRSYSTDETVKNRFAFVFLIAVKEDLRSNGIGGVLLQESKKWLEGQGLTHLQLQVKNENTKAIRFYQKHKFDIVSCSMVCQINK